jgi:multisubunit Na+/H+ antiporter MnhC subunit
MKRLLALLAIILFVDAGTYLLLCKPELDLRKSDPAGYAQLSRVRASAGGIWNLSGETRCLVHCAIATSIVIAAALLAFIVDRFVRERRQRASPKT